MAQLLRMPAARVLFQVAQRVQVPYIPSCYVPWPRQVNFSVVVDVYGLQKVPAALLGM